eukprot:CAMPEP_0113707870 /NCGR_PEP_ID=MMETSP0038_2-20120614/28649_1 /TAXON_ID=2898 /ORGANISM="Cryptomonas paramecium" /LENGTH=320 /DNA_ID=CAMNT_0000633479 /DNA_START=90 /DNA_END=1048 /DNA_ORIENTATION=- /assembly_acc=CAM_ASM_000170
MKAQQGAAPVHHSASASCTSPISAELVDKAKGSMWGLLIGDALAMPTHWYYDQGHLRRTYEKITGYVKPQDKLPGSIMSLSNTGGGGRGSNSGDIVGSVILHGKKQYWDRGANWFYHRGMSAGENTLEGTITRMILRSMLEHHGYDHDAILADYVKLMTTPDSHNDTYAATAHRMFFANWVQGKAPRDCPDNDGHNTDALDGLVNLVPVVLLLAPLGRDVARERAAECASLFRRSSALPRYARLLADYLVDLLEGVPLKEATSSCGRKLGLDVEAMVRRSGGSDPMTACYLDSSFPSLLHYAYKYAHSPEEALLANANAG